MPGRGRPPSLQWEWTITLLFVSTAFIAFYETKILGPYIVNLSISALIISLTYVFFKKHLRGFGPFSPYVLLGLGIFAFWVGSFTSAASAINGLFSPISQSASLLPLDVTGYMAGAVTLSPILPIIFLATMFFLLCEYFGDDSIMEEF